VPRGGVALEIDDAIESAGPGDLRWAVHLEDRQSLEDGEEPVGCGDLDPGAGGGHPLDDPGG
jgi:hypothetical protein